MPAIHSQFNEATKSQQYGAYGNFAKLPVKTSTRGPAPRPEDPKAMDIVDEALATFKANVFFRNYEIEGEADLVLIYLTLYIQDCLQALLKTPTKNDAQKRLATLAMENFAIPGDGNFALGGLAKPPTNRAESDQLRQYMTQLRQEVGLRLVELVFSNADGTASKWWMCFTKRKFMNKTL